MEILSQEVLVLLINVLPQDLAHLPKFVLTDVVNINVMELCAEWVLNVTPIQDGVFVSHSLLEMRIISVCLVSCLDFF